MRTHTVPTPATITADAARVAALLDALPEQHRIHVTTPACEPTGVPTTGSVHRAVRAYIYARDAMTCQECEDGPLLTAGSLIPSPSGGLMVTPTFVTLDHINRRIVGGCHHPHNLRVLCQTCNPRLGNLGGRR